MYTFIATVHQQGDIFERNSQISVFQKIDDISSIMIANIEDSADPMDHRDTIINYAEGTLRFSTAYDGPLQWHDILPFSNCDISLHIFHVRRSETLQYLCAESGFYPICIEHNNSDFKLCIYNSFPTLQQNGLLHPLLATVTKTQTYADGFEYTIQASELPPSPLLMAIFSLPFILNLFID